MRKIGDGRLLDGRGREALLSRRTAMTEFIRCRVIAAAVTTAAAGALATPRSHIR